MGDPKRTTPFTKEERGTDNPQTHDPPPAELSASDEAGARAVLERYPLHGDPPGLIQLAQELHKKFLQATPKAPLTARAAATKLLGIYRKLKEFESSNTRRAGGGWLQYKAPPGMQLRPWTKEHARAVEAIRPFENVSAWEVAAKATGPPLPTPTPPKVPIPSPKAKPAAQKPPDYFKTQIIKMPGMTLTTKLGQSKILASVIRVLSRQALSDSEAMEIASKLDLSKYRVLDFEDTVDHATKVFESCSSGGQYTVKLKNEFFQEVKKATATQLWIVQRVTQPTNDFSEEWYPDFTSNERLWYALERIKNSTSRDPRSGHKPGEIVSPDLIMFVGPEEGDSLYWAPDGRLYGVAQKNPNDQQLNAVIQGFVGADGAMTLGVASFVVAIAAVVVSVGGVAAAPVVAGAYEAVAAAPAVVGAYEAVSYSPLAVWVAKNWEAVLGGTLATINLGTKLRNINPREWFKELGENPKKALGDLLYSMAETGQDVVQIKQFINSIPSMPIPDTGPRPTTPSAPARIADKPAAAARPPISSATETDMPTPPIPLPTANRLASRPQPDLPSTDELAIRRSRMTNPSTATAADQQASAVQRQPARILKKTGTGGAYIADDDETTVTAISTVAGPRQQPPSKPTAGLVRATGNTDKGSTSTNKQSDTRQTGPRNRNTQNTGVPPAILEAGPPVEFFPDKIHKSRLDARERNFLVDNTETYWREMRRFSYLKENPQSTQAHRTTEDEVLTRWPDAVKEHLALTGVTGPGRDAVRQGDTALRLSNPSPGKPPADIIVDFKKTAYIEKPSGKLHTYGYYVEGKTGYESDQIQAYGVAARELGLRIFIIDEHKNIYTPDVDTPDGWIMVAAAPSSKTPKP